MNAVDFLALAEQLAFGDIEALTGGLGLVVVAPHPDDESLGCGGLIAEACARETDVRLIVVSDGVGSHRNSRRYPAKRLKALREAETIEAVSALGLLLDVSGSWGCPIRPSRRTAPLADLARDAIIAAALECNAGAVCTTWRHDPHCDHQAVSTLVEATHARLGGARIWSYPIWGWTLPADVDVGPLPKGMRLDISAHVTAKKRACRRASLSDD